MPTQMTQEQLIEQSLETARKLRNSLLRYLGMMLGSFSIFSLVLGVSDPYTDMSIITVGSLPGYFAVALCILGCTGLLGSILYAHRLWTYIRIFNA